MGIKSLTFLIKNKGSPNCIETKKLYELSGKRVAIDASLFIYQSLINIRKDGEPCQNSHGKTTSHLLGIFYKTVNLISLDIEPIYIFDGKPPEEKRDIIDQRKKIANESRAKLETETDVDKIESLKKKTVRLTYEIVDDIKQLLDLMGVSYIHMDGEAEGLASELCRIGYVDYIMTEDMDSLVFGTPYLIRKCVDRSVKIKDSISVFNLDEILRSFDITYDQFVELCILCGCDYCPSINKIGSITAYKLVKTHGCVENFLHHNRAYPKYEVPDDYWSKFQTSKLLFGLFRDKLSVDTLEVHQSELDFEKLQEYLETTVELSPAKVTTYLEKIKQKYIVE